MRIKSLALDKSTYTYRLSLLLGQEPLQDFGSPSPIDRVWYVGRGGREGGGVVRSIPWMKTANIWV